MSLSRRIPGSTAKSLDWAGASDGPMRRRPERHIDSSYRVSQGMILASRPWKGDTAAEWPEICTLGKSLYDEQGIDRVRGPVGHPGRRWLIARRLVDARGEDRTR